MYETAKYGQPIAAGFIDQFSDFVGKSLMANHYTVATGSSEYKILKSTQEGRYVYINMCSWKNYLCIIHCWPGLSGLLFWIAF